MADLVELTLDSMAHGGDAVGRADGMVFFVPLGAPGDRVRVRVVQQRKSYCRGQIVELLTPGPQRRDPPCELFGQCGGCQLQHLEYSQQATEKEAVLRHALEGKVQRLLPLVPAPQELGYRRRARMQWISHGEGVILGYLERRSRRIVDVQSCPLLSEPLAQGLAVARKHLGRLPRGRGTLSLLAGVDGQVHLSLHTRAGHAGWRKHLEGIQQDRPVVGLCARLGRDRLVLGRRQIALEHGLKASAEAFAQANHQQNQLLRQQVARWAEPDGARVLELHAGVGNFTALLAPPAERLVAVESAPEAARLLRSNSDGKPVTVLLQTAEQALAQLSREDQRFDVVVLDPPREGCRGMAPALAATGAERLIYVSCDPMILARDLEQLGQLGYLAEEAQAVDTMPQTFHMEVVARLRRSPS